MAALQVPSFPARALGFGAREAASKDVRRVAVAASRCGIRSASTAKPASGTPTPKSTRGSGLKKPLHISPALQQFLGTEQASRADTMKLVWDHIKRQNLQSEADRRRIICDEKLKNLLGKDEVNFLEIPGLLSDHFLKTT